MCALYRDRLAKIAGAQKSTLAAIAGHGGMFADRQGRKGGRLPSLVDACAAAAPIGRRQVCHRTDSAMMQRSLGLGASAPTER